jgi:hypothetical protein
VTELRIISDDQMAQIKARRWMRCLFSIEEGHVGNRRNVRITWFGRMIGPIVEHWLEGPARWPGHFSYREANTVRQVRLFWNRMEQSWGFMRLQVIENLVELVGIEPTTSSLRTMKSAVHQDCIFKHLYPPDVENHSIYWNVNGTCGDQVVRHNP